MATQTRDDIVGVRKQVESEFNIFSGKIAKLNTESEKAFLQLNRSTEVSRIIAEAPTYYESLLRLLEISRSLEYSEFRSFAQTRIKEIEKNIREEYKLYSTEPYLALSTGTEFIYYYPIEIFFCKIFFMPARPATKDIFRYVNSFIGPYLFCYYFTTSLVINDWFCNMN